MLFEQEGATFTAYVRERRLIRAHRTLTNRRFDDRGIGEIAWEVWFSDLSYFNRTFRRRFGLSPGAVRAGRADAT
jgi:AraC-like DNA-binding protein